MPLVFNQEESFGQQDTPHVSGFNIISSDGKQTKDLVERPWKKIELVESMGLLSSDSNFLSGSVLIADAVGFMQEFALNGGETIEFTFATPQKPEIHFIGIIYEAVPVDDFNKRSLILNFCSAEKLGSDQMKIQKSYKNMLYSDMANRLFSPVLSDYSQKKKKLYIEPTKTLQSIVVTNRHPADAVSWLAGRSKSEKYQGANYVFYERIDGTFHFTSIEKLVDPAKVKSTMIYYYDKPPKDRVSPENLVRIGSYDILKVPNVISNIQNGMYSGTLVTNDLVKRQHRYNYWNYDDSYNGLKSLNPNKIDGKKTSVMNHTSYSERPSSFVYMAPKHYKSWNEAGVDNIVEETALVRNSQMLQINSIKLQIRVPGDSQRMVGEVIEVVLPSPQPKTPTSGTDGDAVFSGKYLISKVKHHVTSDDTYETVLDLVTDSYGQPLPPAN